MSGYEIDFCKIHQWISGMAMGVNGLEMSLIHSLSTHSAFRRAEEMWLSADGGLLLRMEPINTMISS